MERYYFLLSITQTVIDAWFIYYYSNTTIQNSMFWSLKEEKVLNILK